MNEGNRFVVEVVGRLEEAREITIARVCDALGLVEEKAGALVARMPGVITKPIGEDRAMKIALRLQEAGVPALHRPLADAEQPVGAAERPAYVQVAVPERPARRPTERPAERPTERPAERPAATRPAEPSPVRLEERSPERPEPRPPLRSEPVSPRDVPSLDATHHDLEIDPKLTPMTAAGFGAADIVLPREEDPLAAGPPRPRTSIVEGGSTSVPTPLAEEPAITMVRPSSAEPTPKPPSRPVRNGEPADVRNPTPVPMARPDPSPTVRQAPAASEGAPVYRQTRSAAEPALEIAAPPDEVLKRSGVPDTDLARASAHRRGRLGRHLAAQVALPGLLTWSLTAVALWWFLGAEGRPTFFVALAAATAVAALIGSLLAALGTMGVARDVVRLRDEARRVAMGELTAPVSSNRDDELGDLAGSLERMRLSLQEGLERLRKRRR